MYSYLCYQIRVADNGSDKEAVVRDLCAHLHPRCTQVQVHLVVGTGDGSESEIAHAVELQLKRQRRLQMTVDPVLLKLRRHKQDTITDGNFSCRRDRNKFVSTIFPENLLPQAAPLTLTDQVQIGNFMITRCKCRTTPMSCIK